MGGLILYGPPSAPRRAKICFIAAHFVAHICKIPVVIFVPFYTYVCYVMRSYCAEIFVNLGST